MATRSSAAKKAPTNKKSTFTKTAANAQKKIKSAFSAQKNKAANDSMLEKFFIDSLKDMYWAENHLVKALPNMAKAATTPELAAAFNDHLKVTKTHVQRLEKVFKMLDIAARGKKSEAMEGLVKEGKSIIDDTEDGTATRDVGLIMAAQKVEHYEIASYGGLAQLARTLGQVKVAAILQDTLAEEKEADELLTDIAENDVNYEASMEDEEEEE